MGGIDNGDCAIFIGREVVKMRRKCIALYNGRKCRIYDVYLHLIVQDSGGQYWIRFVVSHFDSSWNFVERSRCWTIVFLQAKNGTPMEYIGTIVLRKENKNPQCLDLEVGRRTSLLLARHRRRPSDFHGKFQPLPKQHLSGRRHGCGVVGDSPSFS